MKKYRIKKNYDERFYAVTNWTFPRILFTSDNPQKCINFLETFYSKDCMAGMATYLTHAEYKDALNQ